jgi:uncharacterized protein with HEPN domain
MLEIIDDLLPLALLSQEEFHGVDRREEAAAYAAALGRAASKLPTAFQNDHREIDWTALEDFRYTLFDDGIDVLILRDRLQECLPTGIFPSARGTRREPDDRAPGACPEKWKR